MRVALRRSHGHAGDGRDLLERKAERVLQDDDAGLFGMLAPTAHGSLELYPVEAMRVWSICTSSACGEPGSRRVEK